MKQFCLLCERTSVDSNLYCQDVNCPAEMSPTILSQGEWLGDIEIIRTLSVLRSSVLYEAMHHGEKVLLKVAHPGDENKERLKREADFLQQIQHDGDLYPYLPLWRPPYSDNTEQPLSFGRIILAGHLLYFYITDFFDGESLRSVITQRPQLWIRHIGWLMIGLSSAVAYMNSKGWYHYAISPETVLINFDKEKPGVPRVLLCDLGTISQAEKLQRNWQALKLMPQPSSSSLPSVLPAYCAPELFAPNRIGADFRTDVYSLGLTLYELLVGTPKFTFKLKSDDEVYQAIKANRRVQMSREQDVKTIADIALQATEQQIDKRYQTSEEFANTLIGYFGEIPEQKKPFWERIKLNQILLVVAIVLGMAFLFAIAFTFFSTSEPSAQSFIIQNVGLF